MTYSIIFTLAGLGFTLAGLLFTFIFDAPTLDQRAIKDIAEWMDKQTTLMSMTPAQLKEYSEKQAQKEKFHFGLSKAGFWFLVSGTILQIAGTLCR